MKFFKKLVVFLLCFTLCCQYPAGAVTISSESDISDLETPIDSVVTVAPIGTQLDIKAKSAILLEVNTGKILYEHNSDEKLPPASITKIMSLLLIIEAIDSSKLSLDDVVTASEHACSMGGSQIWLEPGEAMTVDDLLKATVIASANDATVALGETIAGSEEGFVAMMNARAKELGMTNTHFINATGLDAEGHLSSAHDIAVMSRELIKHDLIKNYSTVWMDTLRDGESELVNTNKLVRFYEGTTGLKTGTTSGAGYCLSATAERNGLELVAVIMSGDTSQERFNGAKKLLDYGFANYEYTSIAPTLDTNIINIKNGVQKTVKIEVPDNFGALLKKSDTAAVTQQINLPKEIIAPIKKGDSVGTVDFYLNGQQIGSINIICTENIDKMNFLTAFLWILDGLLK
ncbi:MAG: D-alanyl-D-alanine carboxypeptidase [Ruminococcaceae bacterium]|nr:D-alanyl-D-alanine carboxypeptidase [Oscillospiraceae bacterium]